jgi:hypothetical protein
MSSHDFIKIKESIFDEILQNIRSWDKTLESGISIIEANQEMLEQINDINFKLDRIEHNISDESNCNQKIIMISRELEQLISWMKELKNPLLDDKRHLEKKNDVVESYIAVNSNSVFVDKNI